MLGRATHLIAALARFYKPFFGGRYLIITNTLSAGFLLGTADIIRQSMERRQKPTKNWDTARTTHMFITGCTVGPLLHYWYFWIDKITPGKKTKKIKVVIIKVVIDQTFAPFFACWYFMEMGLFQGQSVTESWNEFRRKFWEYYLAELSLWPAAQMINFFFLPSAYRVLFVNVVTLGWNVYLSYLKHRNEGE
ncbi:mpv17-like protein 2 [Heteronotia binoei]|uniref:mpv17-like protein 2 n=1 Tax=Heteronotia binoei TaxID=13085 RepID=UPI0029313126|nr:mpv17-like protein 2 [Heteronotia binoei]